VSGYLLDTNQLSKSGRKASKVFSQIQLEIRRGTRVGTCLPVLCEVEVGVANVADPPSYRKNLSRVLKIVRIWPLTTVTSRLYGEIANDLRSRGRVLSQVDIMLAALCRELGLTLVTADKDFAALPWLKTEDWT
jgi:tRNA(fMet)-specific endonuclease VapC